MRFFFLSIVGLLLPVSLSAQNQTVTSARSAFEQLDFAQAVQLARRALDEDLGIDDRVSAFEVLGFSYGALDSADRAVEALGQMIVLDPDREPDRTSLPPRLLNLYTQAFSQVLVVRGMLVDSNSFVAGDGRVTLHYEVSRPSVATLRVIGGGVNTVIDSQLVDPGPKRFDWTATVDDRPVPSGTYQLIVTAVEGRNQYQASAAMTVAHSPVDTVPHLTALPGFTKMAETEIPPRDWRPLGVSALLTGAAAGAALALGSSDLGGPRTELIAVSFTSLVTGLVLSLRKPEPRPIPASIQYNRLLDTLLDERNAQIAAQNEEIRRRVRLTVVEERQ